MSRNERIFTRKVHLKRLTQPHCATSVRISFTSRHCFEKLIDQNDLPCTLHTDKKKTDVDGGVFMSTAHVYFRFIQQYGGPDGDYFCLYKYYNYQLLRKMTRYLPHQIRPALDSLTTSRNGPICCNSNVARFAKIACRKDYPKHLIVYYFSLKAKSI